MFSYKDDNNLSLHYKTNLYLVNNARTTATDTGFYGEILKMLASNVPDGIICYFPNNDLMNIYIEKWKKTGYLILTNLMHRKNN